MKTKLTILALATIGAFGALPASAGSTTSTINVSAQVQAMCRFNSAGPTTLTIANSGAVIDPSIAGPATGSASVLFRCSTGTSSTITADNGLNYTTTRNVKNGANAMPYTLSLTGATQTGTGMGTGQDLTLTVNGSIAQTDYQNAASGSYSDTVTLTIAP